MAINDDGWPENERFWGGARSPWLTLLYWLLGIFYFVGAGGGVWYICHRAAIHWNW
jgi:hypothetical protein